MRIWRGLAFGIVWLCVCECAVGSENGVDDVLGFRVKSDGAGVGEDIPIRDDTGDFVTDGRQVFWEETDTGSAELLETSNITVLANNQTTTVLANNQNTTVLANNQTTTVLANNQTTTVLANNQNNTNMRNGSGSGNIHGETTDATEDSSMPAGDIPVATIALWSASGAFLVAFVAYLWTGSLPSVKGLLHLPSMIAKMLVHKVAGHGAVFPLPTAQSGEGGNTGELVFRV